MEVEIEVFFHSEETLKLENSSVDYSVLECDTRLMTFYNIDAITQYIDEKSNEWFCKIWSTGTSWIATKNYDEVKQLIYEQIKACKG